LASPALASATAFVMMSVQASNGLLQLMMRIGKRADVVNCHPRRFRHTFAISFLRAGGSPLQLQRILEHETLAMTAHYTAFQAADLQESHELYSPLMHHFKVNTKNAD
jgi:site-specific recombinase XerD